MKRCFFCNFDIMALVQVPSEALWLKLNPGSCRMKPNRPKKKGSRELFLVDDHELSLSHIISGKTSMMYSNQDECGMRSTIDRAETLRQRLRARSSGWRICRPFGGKPPAMPLPLSIYEYKRGLISPPCACRRMYTNRSFGSDEGMSSYPGNCQAMRCAPLT